VSPEANDFFDLIVELHRACSGAWVNLTGDMPSKPVKEQLDGFLQYAALFLHTMGDYYV